MSEQQESFKEQQLRAEIRNISEALSVISPSDIPKLREYVFVNVFLPLFAGDETLLYGQTFQTWTNFAGSAYTAVDVTDDNGVVLFTVPPLLDRTTVNTITAEGPSIAHVVVTAEQYARVHPNQGRAYLNNELTKRALTMKVPANLLNHLEVWNAIFERYKRPAIMPLEEAKQVQQEPKTSEADFEPL